LFGEIEYVQVAADCVTVNVCPAMVIVPLRCDAVGFAPMSNVTAPSPLPLAGPENVNHAALLVADHAHPSGAVIDDDPLAAPAPASWLAGEIAYVHGAADCVTVNVWPPIVNVAMRCDAFGFAATVKVVVPLPLPLEPPVIANHGSLLAAVHAHPPGAVTFVDPAPPPATTV
jgi:hypothetical protein